MEIANIMLALGGDSGNTIPKFGVTVSEIAVLQAIHGNEAVTEIEPIGVKETSNREELGRLMLTYGRARPEGSSQSFVQILFPGAAARVFTTLDELDLDESFYKAEKRAKPASSSKAAKSGAADPDEPKLTAAEKKKIANAARQAAEDAKKAAAGSDQDTPPVADEDGDDGVGDINDEHNEDQNKPLFA